MKKKILLIGLGYVGSAIYKKLHTIYDIDTCDYVNELATYKFNCGYLDYPMFKNYDIIIYMAGNSSVSSCEDIKNTITNNVYGLEHVLHTISLANSSRLNPIKFIYASSASVYGSGLGINPMNIPSRELHPLHSPINLYDASKQIGDIIANMYSNQIEIYGLRFGTVNGYSPLMRWDLIINSMYKSAMETGIINVVNPNIHRAILFIDDLVDSIQAIIDNEEYTEGGIFNIASFNDTIGNIAEYIVEAINKPIEINTSFELSTYDFCINCDKFNNNIKPILFRNTSRKTIELIVKSLSNEC